MKNYVALVLAAAFFLAAPPAFSDAPQSDIPKAAWEPVFFKEIDRTAMATGLDSLRARTCPAGDWEIRIWVGFGLSPLELFVLKKSEQQWTGLHMFPGTGKLVPARPKADIAGLWQQLTATGFWELPDASRLNNEMRVLDGTSYVVEILHGSAYRTFYYPNPAYQHWPEAKKLLEGIQAVKKTFGIKEKE